MTDTSVKGAAVQRSNVSNVQVASDIDVDHSMVSKIRSGKVTPGLMVMLRIEDLYGWSLRHQTRTKIRGAKDYANAFEIALEKHYTRKEQS